MSQYQSAYRIQPPRNSRLKSLAAASAVAGLLIAGSAGIAVAATSSIAVAAASSSAHAAAPVAFEPMCYSAPIPCGG